MVLCTAVVAKTVRNDAPQAGYDMWYLVHSTKKAKVFKVDFQPNPSSSEINLNVSIMCAVYRIVWGSQEL